MKRVIATFNSPGYQELADLTLPTKIRYAERWKIDLHSRVFEGNTDHIGWYRFVEILHLLDRYDEVFWMDADVIVMNSEKCVQELEGPIVCAADLHGLNTGVVIARSHPLVKQLFFVITGGYGFEHFGNHVWGEQAAFIHLLRSEPYHQLLNAVPQRMLNSYLNAEYGWPEYVQGNYEPGDFILQLAGLPYQRRVELARKYAALAT